MPHAIVRLACLALALGAVAGPVRGQQPPAERDAPDPARAETLTVGVVDYPPFVMQEAGDWTGLAIELWRLTADQLGYEYRFVPYDDVADLLAAVRAGKVDVGAGPLVITPTLQREMDFTIPYLHAGLAIAALPPSFGGWMQALARTFSGRVWLALLGLLGAAFLFGMIVWLLERRRNVAHFGGGVLQGVGEGIWWATSTMTTVGYGDRTPVTPWGRTVGVVWMFASIVLIASFTAMVTSTLTVHQLRPMIRSVHDLAHLQVGVVRGSNAAVYLDRHHIDVVDYDDLESGLEAVAEGRVVAFVGEAPSLRYLARTQFKDRLSLAPHVFDYEYVAFAVPNDSRRRRTLNVALLQVLRTDAWDDQLHHYLGIKS